MPENYAPEDPELDFTDFMEKHKANLQATTPEQKPQNPLNKPMSPVMIRGIIFFVILLVLLGVLIYLFLNRQVGASVQAPEGFRIIDNGKSPPKIEKLK